MSSFRSRLAPRLAFAALVLAPSLGAAQTIQACYVPASGTVYRINATNAPGACLTGHVAFSWTSGGAAQTSFNVNTAAPAFDVTNAGTGAAGWFKNTNTGVANAINAEASGTAAAIRAINLGAGSGANISTNGTAASAIIANNNGSASTGWFKNASTDAGNALYAESASSWATLQVENKGVGNVATFKGSTTATAASVRIDAFASPPALRLVNVHTQGNALNAESAGDYTTANITNLGTTGSALYTEARGAGNVFSATNKATTGGLGGYFRSEATTNGQALAGDSFSNYSTARFNNLGTTGNALALGSQAGNSTLNVNNTGLVANASAAFFNTQSTTNTTTLSANSRSNYTTAYFDNQGTTGGALGLKNNQANGATMFAENLGGGGAAFFKDTAGVLGVGSGSTLGVYGAAQGGALWVKNIRPVNGQAMYGENNASNASTVAVNNTSSGGALYATSNGGNTIVARQLNTGNSIALVARSNGTYPTAQFEHQDDGNNTTTTGPALRVFGYSDLIGNLQVGGTVTVNGTLQVNGSKNAIVPTSSGMKKVYSEESTEVWFSDYGFGKLTNGEVWIPLDSGFVETVTAENPYHVFVQPYGDAELVVTKRTAQGFAVKARSGDGAADFSYRIVAKRKGFESERLAPADPVIDAKVAPKTPAAPANSPAPRQP